MTQHNHAILCQQNGKFTTQGKLLAPLLVEIYLLLDSFAEPPYAPQVNDYILFLEEAEEDDYHDFDRNLAAITSLPQSKSGAYRTLPKGMPNNTRNINLYPRQAPTS